MIAAEHLKKSYGRKPVLRDLSILASAGAITLLVGANAAGKTTTMKVLAGLVRPNGGTAEIIRFYARLRGLALSRCEAMLDQAGLREFERVYAGELSGGTRQRLGLALLLLPDAPVLLLDEPGLSLDPAWRKRLQETLRFEAERGKAVLVTTHLIAEWNNVAHRCFLCADGKIERELDPRNLPHNFDEIQTATHDATARSTTNEPHFSIVG